ncbi:MAG: hypothetical protein AAAC48_23600 [Phyllobacterium sp.]
MDKVKRFGKADMGALDEADISLEMRSIRPAGLKAGRFAQQTNGWVSGSK